MSSQHRRHAGEGQKRDSHGKQPVGVVKRQEPRAEALAHDWNESVHATFPLRPLVLDETLRDGLQSTSVRDPSIGEKIELLHKMVALGIDGVSLGIPCAHARQYEDALRLAREIADHKLPIKACCAARTRVEDIQLVAEISQRSGIAVEAGTFIGSSPIRQAVENWTVDYLERLTAEAVTFATKNGLPVLFVTEDTTRSSPDVLARLYRTAIRCGAQRVCLADTVGHATPAGARRVVKFIASLIAEMNVSIGIDWHGHRDRGLELSNCFAAWEAGAERCHATALGVGERSGNTPMEILLVNLFLEGFTDRDLSHLSGYVASAAQFLAVQIPPQHPVFGADAFRTATGVHASAMIKALQRNDGFVEQLYSGVPASMVGRHHVIEVGPMSGESNVRYCLASYGIPCDDDLVREIVTMVKQKNQVMSRAELVDFARNYEATRRSRASGRAAARSSAPPAWANEN